MSLFCSNPSDLTENKVGPSSGPTQDCAPHLHGLLPASPIALLLQALASPSLGHSPGEPHVFLLPHPSRKKSSSPPHTERGTGRPLKGRVSETLLVRGNHRSVLASSVLASCSPFPRSMQRCRKRFEILICLHVLSQESPLPTAVLQ